MSIARLKFVLAIVFFLRASLVFCETWNGKVIGVSDGDTIKVLQDKTTIKIRLYGVDAPEKEQPVGQRAKQFTSNLVFGKIVTVQTVAKDHYGRMVAKVYIGDKCLNEMLLAAGMAWHYRQYDKTKYLSDLEWIARKDKKGLWIDEKPVAPWEWRRVARAKKEHSSSLPHFASSVFRGNVKSKKFHHPKCRDYECKHCTVVFGSYKEAIKAGYKPCGMCKPKGDK